jgi:TPR repeat protein
MRTLFHRDQKKIIPIPRTSGLHRRGALVTVAATAGLPEAQIALGMLFTLGKGVVQDFTEACYWLALAAEGEVNP